jgi:hypothetical protein
MSKVVGFVVGVALIAVGIVTGNPALIIQGSAMVVMQAVVLLTAPKTPARQASEMSIQLGEQPRVLLVGETFTPGSLVDGFNYGGKYGTDWEVLIIRLADHKCHSLIGFYVNDEYHKYKGDGDYREFDPTDDDLKFRLFFRADTTNDPLPDIVLDNGPGWTSADIGESGCDVIVAYRADKPDEKHPAWPGGRPRFGFVLKGAFCYDPRLDDTVTGGSGPHRIDDPDTWEWTENAAICRYKWVRGVYANDDNSDQTQLLIGRGLTAEEAPPENVFAAANLCDEASCPALPFTEADANGFGLNFVTFTPDHRFFLVDGGGHFQVWDALTRQTAGPIQSYIGGGTAAAEDGFYALNDTFGSELYFVSFGGGESVIVPSSEFPTAMGTVWYAGGRVLLADLIGGGPAYLVTGGTVYTVVGSLAESYFTGPDGGPWGVSQSGSDLSFVNVLTEEVFTVPSPTTGSAYAMTNPDGNIVVLQNGWLILVDPVAETVLDDSGSGVVGTNPVMIMRNIQPRASSLWAVGTEYSTTTLQAIRTVDMTEWAPVGSSLSDTVYSPLGHTLISRPFLGDTFQFRALDHHAGYRVAGPIYANQDFIDVEGMFAAATGGTVVTREGSVELNPGHAESVVATFTDDDLLSGSKVGCNRGILSESSEEWLNTVVARYVEPEQKWQDHGAPVVRDTADITADGRPREASISLRLVRYVEQALRVAEIQRKLGRLWWRGTVTLGPSFCEIEDGDWVTWVSSRFPLGSMTFRVEAYSIDEKWQNTLTLRQINADVYGCGEFDPDLSQPSTPPFLPDIGSPDPDNWTLTAVSLASGGASIPALRISGSADDDTLVSAIIFEYWQDDGIIDPVADPDAPAWIVYGTLPASTTQVDISSVTGGSVYYAAVTYIVDGEPGDRLVLGPVTIGNISIGARRFDSTLLTMDSTLETMDLG